MFGRDSSEKRLAHLEMQVVTLFTIHSSEHWLRAAVLPYIQTEGESAIAGKGSAFS